MYRVKDKNNMRFEILQNFGDNDFQSGIVEITKHSDKKNRYFSIYNATFQNYTKVEVNNKNMIARECK